MWTRARKQHSRQMQRSHNSLEEQQPSQWHKDLSFSYMRRAELISGKPAAMKVSPGKSVACILIFLLAFYAILAPIFRWVFHIQNHWLSWAGCSHWSWPLINTPQSSSSFSGNLSAYSLWSVNHTSLSCHHFYWEKCQDPGTAVLIFKEPPVMAERVCARERSALCFIISFSN